MKKTYKLRSLLLAGVVALATLTAHAELLLNENFEYTTTELYGNGNWWKYSSNPNEPVSLVEPALTYTGYQKSPVGKSVKLGNAASGQDMYKMLDATVGEGSIYVAALLNLTDADEITESNTTYFLCLVPQTKSGLKDGGSGSEYGRLFAYAASEGKYKLAISRNNTTLVTAPAEYEYGVTYLVVVKYTIVEGTTNDEVRLYVNPASEEEPATADALYNSESGGDASLTYGGLAALELRQGATATKMAPVLTLDAIRVATTWAELFTETGGGDTPGPVYTPAISVSSTAIEFDETFYIGGPSASRTIIVRGENLTADITLTSSSEAVVVTPATVTKEDAMSETGAEVTVTISPVTVIEGFPTITLASEGAQEATIKVSASVFDAVADFAAMKAKEQAEGYYYGVISGEIAITYTFVQGNQQCFYLQDATAGFLIYDSYGNMGDLVAGDRLSGALVYYAGGEFYIQSIGTKGENAPVEPLEITLAELAAGATEYAYRLVRVNDVLFSETGEFVSGKQYDIAQGETTAKVSLFSESDIIGTQIPGKADIVGVCRNTTGQLISPRTLADITPKTIPSALNEVSAATLYTEAGMLCIDAPAGLSVAVYNLLGAQVATLRTTDAVNRIALSEGAYLVRVNGKASKVIVK